MRERERRADEHEPEPQQPADGRPGADNLTAHTEAAQRLLAAGDDAIERALSGNSETFLAATRQHGGQ